MDSTPTLVYLHGVGDGDSDESWRPKLDASLRAAGYPGLEGVHVIAPKYPNTLRHPSDDQDLKLPPRTVPRLEKDDERRLRREFERRTADLERLLGPHAPGHSINDVGPVADTALWFITQAKRYVTESDTRAATLWRALSAIPKHGDIVLVGHSLGSLVAIDLLEHLPEGVRVRGLVTLGSPAGHPAMHRGTSRLLRTLPISRVDWWVNAWNSSDVVSGLRGISQQFPWALDLKLNLGMLVHGSSSFMASPTVATAIGRGLFGSLSKEIQPLLTTPEARLNDVEIFLLLGLSYAHFIKDHLREPTRRRWDASLQIVQKGFVEGLIEQYGEQGIRVPEIIARCRHGERPPALSVLSKEESVTKLVTITTSNVLAPFEITISNEVQKEALSDVTVAMGLGGSFGKNVNFALSEANRVIKPGDDWKRWALIGGGALLFVLGPVALVMAAPAGLAGGAAIVSALASFGPGGMVGGLMTAGALTTTGASTVAAALVSSESTAESVESVIVQLLAALILRSKEKLPQDLGSWSALTELQRQVLREIQRLSPYSDENAPTLRALQRKAEAIDRAVEYVIDRSFFPDLSTDVPNT